MAQESYQVTPIEMSCRSGSTDPGIPWLCFKSHCVTKITDKYPSETFHEFQSKPLTASYFSVARSVILLLCVFPAVIHHEGCVRHFAKSLVFGLPLAAEHSLLRWDCTCHENGSSREITFPKMLEGLPLFWIDCQALWMASGGYRGLNVWQTQLSPL